MAMIRLVISDFDRTFTDETLQVSQSLIDAIDRIKASGVSFTIVSGRKYSFLYDTYNSLNGVIDSFVAENGCVGYFNGRKYIIGDGVDRERLLKNLKKLSVPFDYGDVIVSVDHRYEKELARAMNGIGGSFDVIRNIDSLMVLPRNVSKSSGAAWLAHMYRVGADQTACIGDAENDVSLRGVCTLLGAVSNAIPAMKNAADYVCKQGYGEGLIEFLEYVEHHSV